MSKRMHDSNSVIDQRETNTTRLTAILNDAALRLLYREFLRETLCEENLAFYLDVEGFNHNFHSIDLSKPDAVRETLAAAYGMLHYPVEIYPLYILPRSHVSAISLGDYLIESQVI